METINWNKSSKAVRNAVLELIDNPQWSLPSGKLNTVGLAMTNWSWNMLSDNMRSRLKTHGIVK